MTPIVIYNKHQADKYIYVQFARTTHTCAQPIKFAIQVPTSTLLLAKSQTRIANL